MKAFQGIVKSAKMANTAIVEVERFHVHPLYEKRVKRTKGYAVHTDSVVAVGDTVRFIECSPISKSKRWKVIEIISKRKVSKVPEVSKVSKVKETPKVKRVAPKKKGAKK